VVGCGHLAHHWRSARRPRCLRRHCQSRTRSTSRRSSSQRRSDRSGLSFQNFVLKSDSCLQDRGIKLEYEKHTNQLRINLISINHGNFPVKNTN
jgi:hypothetical protein